jgi:hypothetical protein
MAVFTRNWKWTNSAGRKWEFKKGDVSDGHSTGTYFRHFDAWVIAAICHDQDCIRANEGKSYAMRRAGDKAYKFNLSDLKAPKTTVYNRYTWVSGYAYKLKLTGKLK